MATAVETLGKLERRITISFPLTDVRTEVEKRLKVQARTAKAPGFRPGKVPLKMVAAQYGYQIESEVLNDKVGRAFNDAANENNLRVAGFPNIVPKEEAAEGQLAFDATFEVYPEVAISDLTAVEIETVQAEVSEAEIDKTIDILRKQRVHFHTKGEAGEHGDGGEAIAANGDRVTVDFVGSIDGVEFPGGKAEGYAFVLGEGRMLPEFEAATLGLKVGESKTFPLSFHEDYHGKDVAGKTADFLVTVKKIEAANLPEVNDALAKSLGIADGSVEGLRADIKKNLEREVKFRLLARNKQAVMDALVAKAELDLPNASVQAEIARLLEGARADLKQRGLKDADKAEIPEDVFRPQAERRVRLGLVLAELVRANELQAKPEQLKAHIDELAASYEKPEDVVRWYFGDRQRLAEVEAVVIENNVTEFVLGKAKVVEKAVSFDELMAQQG